jgi:hypothetical protein
MPGVYLLQTLVVLFRDIFKAGCLLFANVAEVESATEKAALACVAGFIFLVWASTGQRIDYRAVA